MVDDHEDYKVIADLTDHIADASAHHVKYTDVNARNAIYSSLPAFLYHTNATQFNKTGDGTGYFLLGDFWTQIIDNLGDFSEGTFTAPVSGLYLLSGYIRLHGINVAHTRASLGLITSNRNYFVWLLNVGAIQVNAYYYSSFFTLADMDVDDVARLKLEVFNGLKTVDVITPTVFSGALVLT